MTFYRMKILTKTEVVTYDVKPISLYEWDRIVKVNELDSLQVLQMDLDLQKKITTLMIHPDFIMKFYNIIDSNRPYAFFYKNHLMPSLYGIEYNTYEADPEFQNPYLLYIEGNNRNATGDYMKYDYIDDTKWNYEYVIKEINEKYNINDAKWG